MANKQKKEAPQVTLPIKTSATASPTPTTSHSFKNRLPFNGKPSFLNNPYLPGIILLALFTIIALLTFGDYGVAWDEPFQRAPGLLSFDYMFHGSQELFMRPTDNHGAGFELLLVMIEKSLKLTDSRDIYEMRHLVTHLLFLGGAFALYILTLRLYNNRFLASLAFLMLVCAPRLYAHSFFNSKDIPFLSMVVISFTFCRWAFDKNKPVLFLALGLICGYATSIRIMGIMLAALIILFLVVDLCVQLYKKEQTSRTLLNILLFSLGFCFLLYAAWPYLWKHPLHNFAESFNKLSRFDLWSGDVLLAGKYIKSTDLPWTYFPTWFLITLPEIWLLAGIAGIGWLAIDIFKKPLTFLQNTHERNNLLFLACFFIPVFAVIILHSIIYDDWRHLYFIYPSFILTAIYLINKLLKWKYAIAVRCICSAQVALIAIFMYENHPFNQVYFNYFVSHSPESLRKNFEMDYWGCSFKQGLENLVANADPSKKITVYCDYKDLFDNNLLALPSEDRGRFQYADEDNADYYLTNFRGHTIEYPAKDLAYACEVLNSKLFCAYHTERDPTLRKQLYESKIAFLSQSLATNPNDLDAQARIANSFLRISEFDSAEAHFEKAVEISHGNPELYMSMAGAYIAAKKYPSAINCFRNMIDQDRNNPDPYSFIGVCYFYMKQTDSTVYYLRQAIAMNPKNPGYYSSLSHTYQAMGIQDSANKYDALAHSVQGN